MAAKQLDINYSTAKAITKQYEKRGHIFKRRIEMEHHDIRRPRNTRKRAEQDSNIEQEVVENRSRGEEEPVVQNQTILTTPPMPIMFMPPMFFYPTSFSGIYNPFNLFTE